MKRLLLAGTAFLGLAASGSVAHATPFDFTYSGSLVDFTIPTTGTYQILAFGAQGGNFVNGNMFGPGGLGAEIGGDFSLTSGEKLQIAVGGAGSGLGGGGGSFVVGPGNTPLVIAGGGGGGGGWYLLVSACRARAVSPAKTAATLRGQMVAVTATVVGPARSALPVLVAADFSAQAATIYFPAPSPVAARSPISQVA
jgi:hypothetical protein